MTGKYPLMRNSGLARRCGAMLYDGLLVLALMGMATLPFVALRGGEPVAPGQGAYRLALLAVSYLFFVGFWTKSGRTLGMQAWRVQVETITGQRPDIARASLRFFAAVLSLLPFGMGFWWQLFDRDNLAWHDRLSGTRLKFYPKTDSSENE